MEDRARTTSAEPRVLRVGVLRGREVLVERLVRPGEDVTIGSSPRNSLVVVGEGLPQRHLLFVAGRRGYQLRPAPGMAGQLATEHGRRSLDVRRTALSDRSRGRLTLGELTILFQFVPAPPGLLVGPAAFRPTLLDEDDPVFLGSLSLFSAVAGALMAYVFSVEPVDLVAGGQVPDRFVEVLMAAPSTPDPAPPPELEEVESDQGVVAQRDRERVEEVEEVRPRTPEQAAAARAAQAVQQRDEVIARSRLLAELIRTNGETDADPALRGMLSDDDPDFANLQESLNQVNGVAIAGSPEAAASRGATDRRGRGDAGIGDLRRAETGLVRGVARGPGTRPTGRLTQEEFDRPAEGGDEAGKTFRLNRGQVQACYEKELLVDPTLRGRLAVTVMVDSGKVRSVQTEGTSGTKVEQCVSRKIRLWRFDESVTGELYSVFVLEPGG